MIEFELGFQYAEEQRAALQQVSGAVAKGRCVVLCGSSGCGKSTLLRCVNGLIPQFYEGERKGFCRLAGQENADLSIGEIGELAASVFQDPRSQFFTVNSSGEVAFGLENHGVPQEKIRRRVDEAFRVFHLEHLQDRNVYELSSGERQLISILAAWAMDTEIFLLDEPTANLDFAATRQLREQAPPSSPRYGQARFHPLTKLASWLVVMIAISTANNRFAFTVYGALLLLAAADGWIGTALAGAGLFGVLWTAAAVFPHTVCTFLLVLFPRIIAIWISMQTLIGRNEAGRTLTALRQCHLPERLIMVVAVIFRFFPVLAGDMKLLRQSIATRGAFVTFGQKLRAFPSYLEILTIPMALRVIRIAETLSASAETRGIDLKGRKTNYLILHGSLWDAVLCAILLTAVIVGLWR